MKSAQKGGFWARNLEGEGERIPQILDMRFQIAVTSERGQFWLSSVQRAWRLADEKRKKEKRKKEESLVKYKLVR